MDKQQVKKIVEALVFASESPISVSQLASIIEVEKAIVEEAIELLTDELKDRSILLKKVSGGYEFATRPEFSQWIKKMFVGKAKSRLSRAALETLAIIAFKQPISKVEVSAIRGVNSDGVIKGLLERRFISISGRADGPGRPLLFVTTKEFLRYFGINDISDLPKPKEIEELLAEGEGNKVISEIPEEELLTGEENGADESAEKAEQKETPEEESEQVTSETQKVEANVEQTESLNDSTQ